MNNSSFVTIFIFDRLPDQLSEFRNSEQRLDRSDFSSEIHLIHPGKLPQKAFSIRSVDSTTSQRKQLETTAAAKEVGVDAASLAVLLGPDDVSTRT